MFVYNQDMEKDDRIIFHIDVNSAFLSWEAANRLVYDPAGIDLRCVPSVVGGDVSKRRGIVLAKSSPAKKYGIMTGETLYAAKQKCPNLTVVTPTYNLYSKCSDMFVNFLKKYTSEVEQYSVDECFVDITSRKALCRDPIKTADEIRRRISRELGFTVNVGISSNKFLAKMGSELKKPDMTHTLFPSEIKEKLWPLDISEMFMVGARTCEALRNMKINTIGQLANADRDMIMRKFKNVRGGMLLNYSNGIDYSEVKRTAAKEKSVSNSATLPKDVSSARQACEAILFLCESVCTRLRKKNFLASSVSLHLKGSDFSSASLGMNLAFPSAVTEEIYKACILLFERCWNRFPLRQIGVCTFNLTPAHSAQLSFFNDELSEKHIKIEQTIDNIRNDYGARAIKRGVFVNNEFSNLRGNNPPENEMPRMKSYL